MSAPGFTYEFTAMDTFQFNGDGPGAMLVGHQPCSTCRGGHTTWTRLACGAVVYGPPLRVDCRVLAGPAAVR